MPDVFVLPLAVQIVLAFFFGSIIGSFLNVVIYRLHTNKSLSGRSHCLACGYTLQWYDLVPVGSYLLLRGRCRRCQARITPRYAVVELLTAALFALTVALVPLWWPLAILLVVQAVLVVILVYDYYHLIIPDRLVLWLLVLAAAYLALTLGSSWLDWLWTVAAALAGASTFALLWLVSRGRWIGLGDAKLALPLGLLVGPSAVFSLIVLSFWVGAVVSVMVLAWQYWRRGQRHLRFLSRPLTIHSEVPFAPFLIAAFWLVYFFSIDVLALTAHLLFV